MNRKTELRDRIMQLVGEYHRAALDEARPFVPGSTPVRYAGRHYDENELGHLIDASLEFWLTAGRYCEKFERDFARYLNGGAVSLVNSGSSANLVAVSTLTSPLLKDRRLRPGDEVITAAAGFPTTVNPIIQNQAIPVFVDVALGSYVPTIESIERAISSKTRAIILAHTLGVPFAVSEIRELCDRKGIWLIEDCCDALGSRYDGKLTGGFGHLSTFSFYPAHHITMGEGGAVVTGDSLLSKIARSFRDWGRDCYCPGGRNNSCGKRFSGQFGTLPPDYDHKYVYSHIGYNLKVTEMQAAIGVAQLAKIEDLIASRKRNHEFLDGIFSRFEDTFVLHRADSRSDPSWFGYVLTIRPEARFSRFEMVQALEKAKIETRSLFCGNLLRHPAYVETVHRVAEPLLNTDLITGNTFFIGVFPGITQEMLNYIGEVVDRFIRARAP